MPKWKWMWSVIQTFLTLRTRNAVVVTLWRVHLHLKYQKSGIQRLTIMTSDLSDQCGLSDPGFLTKWGTIICWKKCMSIIFIINISRNWAACFLLCRNMVIYKQINQVQVISANIQFRVQRVKKIFCNHRSFFKK